MLRSLMREPPTVDFGNGLVPSRGSSNASGIGNFDRSTA
jgi:hypothetical protein